MFISAHRHSNQCPRCPVLGEENQPTGEWYQFLNLRFDIRAGRSLSHPSMLRRVDPVALAHWLACTHILEPHISHLPDRLGPGLMVTLPNNCGRLIIDGNHRAARALRRGEEFLAFLLPERETHKLLRRSMGKKVADQYWQKLLQS